MELQTHMALQGAENRIDYQSRLLLLGSCFVENIGGKLDRFKFRSLQNPFGILFHPLALETLIERAMEGREYLSSEIFEQEGIWYCFDAHSQLRATKGHELLALLNKRLVDTREVLESASHIIITLGTAWVYDHRDSGKTVANCHKRPQREFDKRLLSVDQIASSLERLLALVGKVNPGIQPIFTISPVRHLKDGFVENQRSKAHLISALHQVLEGQGPGPAKPAYFPSYEIVMDELRDYRFYGRDMVHPNELAIDYVWEAFQRSWVAPECISIMREVDNLQKGLGHRPFNPDSLEHQKFREALRKKIAYLQEAYPFMKFE